jgi:hypothetical protein
MLSTSIMSPRAPGNGPGRFIAIPSVGRLE